MYVGYAKRKRTVFCLSFINQYIMLICNNIQQNENTLIHGLVKYIIFYIKIWTINSFNFTKPNRVCTNRYGIYNQGGVWQYITMIVLLQEPFECVKVLYTLYAIYDCMCSLSTESNSLFFVCSVPSHPVVIYIMCICSVINKMILPKFTCSYC